MLFVSVMEKSQSGAHTRSGQEIEVHYVQD